ncbi:MAG: hypothetical protein ACFFAO_20090 [Candidatus Hermodarchaeota archaeon]
MAATKKRSLPVIGKCFDHLGGKIAPVLFKRLREMEWITPQEEKKTVFNCTELGAQKFKEIFDIDISNLKN